MAGQSLKKRGRKQKQASFSELMSIAREWRRQGYPGSRPVIASLPEIRVKLIRSVIAGLKLKRKQRYNRVRAEVRTRVAVHSPGQVITMDGATTEKGDFIVHRDRGSLSVNAEPCEEHLRAEDTLRLLEQLKTNDRLPLVMCSDNGSPFCCGPVGDFLKANKVIHLRSLPRVPQHNGSAESAVYDFKHLTKAGFTTAQACFALNNHRRRASLNWQTPREAEQTNLKLCTPEERALFFDTANQAIAVAVLGTRSAYEKRKAEREAIFQTMESFSLITRTRGRQTALAKAEEIT